MYMRRFIITDIRYLVGVHQPAQPLRGEALAQLPILEHAYLAFEGDRIIDFGSMADLVRDVQSDYYSANGGSILPAWCDSHTHLVFAAPREQEFVAKIKGKSYAEIAAAGGGILNSAERLVDMPEETLYDLAYARLQECISMGTGAIEIKSGYGLTLEAELKILRVIKALKSAAPIPIKASFLGAHAYPAAFKNNQEGYLQLIIEQMIPAVAKAGLADYIDVFCEVGFFSPADMRRILEAGIAHDLKPKVHVNQLHSIGGLQEAISLHAVSVDHLETMLAADIEALSNSHTIGTLLPTAAYFLRMPFQPARQLIDANCAIALASDFNPGSSPSGNMNTVVSMSCIQMRMLPEEAIQAATIQGAFAMELEQEVGSIAVGKRANVILTKPISSLAYLPYSFGTSNIQAVFIAGKINSF
jgi:imidazolonepropionase